MEKPGLETFSGGLCQLYVSSPRGCHEPKSEFWVNSTPDPPSRHLLAQESLSWGMGTGTEVGPGQTSPVQEPSLLLLDFDALSRLIGNNKITEG